MDQPLPESRTVLVLPTREEGATVDIGDRPLEEVAYDSLLRSLQTACSRWDIVTWKDVGGDLDDEKIAIGESELLAEWRDRGSVSEDDRKKLADRTGADLLFGSEVAFSSAQDPTIWTGMNVRAVRLLTTVWDLPSGEVLWSADGRATADPGAFDTEHGNPAQMVSNVVVEFEDAFGSECD